MLDTFRQGVRVGHLAHPFGDAAVLAAPSPANRLKLPAAGRLQAGERADLIIVEARNMDQVIARPHSDRVVVRNGRRLDHPPPRYDELARSFARVLP